MTMNIDEDRVAALMKWNARCKEAKRRVKAERRGYVEAIIVHVLLERLDSFTLDAPGTIEPSMVAVENTARAIASAIEGI